MKNVLTKVAAIVLTVWYSMSIIGFDVHTCSGSGRSFVVTFVEGLTCEDIHPEHNCEKTACCHHHESEEDMPLLDSKSCCSSDYQVITLTGTPDDSSCESYSIQTMYAKLHIDSDALLYSEKLHLKYLHIPDLRVGKACDGQAALGIWRI